MTRSSSGVPPVSSKPVRIGVSRCLLGEEVRYDGGHKRDRFLTDVFGRYVEWVPICPEVEAGLGTPREAMRLVGDPSTPRLMTIQSERDMTKPLVLFSDRKLDALETSGLSGYVFKKDSPSCGLERVRIFNRHGMPNRNGIGLFARAFTERFPLVPVEEEGRLCDPVLRDNFIERVFCYHRWRQLAQGPLIRQSIVQFHTVHKYLLLAHSRQHYQELGRLVARIARYRPKEAADRYGQLFMEALAVTATRRKHVNVLQHLIGHMKEQFSASERKEIDGVVEDYREGLVPLVVPLTLVKHYVGRYHIGYLEDQVYLNPHPKELKLRNHV
jgi:uncharacterized protein YbgA (DUF1722 family)/uncharacterized protein YbbK (DUF523 family)